MDNFTFVNTTKIIFGKSTEEGVGKEIKPFSSKVLLHYGKDSVKKSGLLDRICRALDKEGIQHVELGGVSPNPRLSLAREGIRICPGEEAGLRAGGGRRERH